MSHQSPEFVVNEIHEGNSTLREFIGFFRDLVVILLIVLFLRTFIVTPFRINGSSMETSYHDKEYILVDKISYLNLPVTYSGSGGTDSLWNSIQKGILSHLPIHIGDPVRGDVVVITPHVDKSKEYYIKRVVGLPGDTIRFEDGEVFIKKYSPSGSGAFIRLDEKYLSPANRGNTRLPETISQNEFLIPEGYYWVMGDNRNNSADSRQCFRDCNIRIGELGHFIHRGDIIGTVLLNFGYFNILGENGLLQSGKFHWTYPPRFLSHPRNASYPELD